MLADRSLCTLDSARASRDGSATVSRTGTISCNAKAAYQREVRHELSVQDRKA